MKLGMPRPEQKLLFLHGGPVSTRTLSSDTLGMCCVKYEDGAGRSNERNYDYDNDGGAVTLVGASCRLIKGEPDAKGRRATIRRGPPSGTATTTGRDLAPRRGASGLANCQRSQQRSRIMRPMGMRPGTAGLDRVSPRRQQPQMDVRRAVRRLGQASDRMAGRGPPARRPGRTAS